MTTNRSAILAPAFAKRLNAGSGMLNAVVAIDGVIAGNWKRTIVRDSVIVDVAPFRPLPRRERRAVEEAAARYAAFLTPRFAREAAAICDVRFAAGRSAGAR